MVLLLPHASWAGTELVPFGGFTQVTSSRIRIDKGEFVIARVTLGADGRYSVESESENFVTLTGFKAKSVVVFKDRQGRALHAAAVDIFANPCFVNCPEKKQRRRTGNFDPKLVKFVHQIEFFAGYREDGDRYFQEMLANVAKTLNLYLADINLSSLNPSKNEPFSKKVSISPDEARQCLPKVAVDCSTGYFGMIPVIGYFDEVFEQACVHHDYCYRFGALTYSMNRDKCDLLFLSEMVDICKTSSIGSAPCEVAAKVYFKAVHSEGAPFFKNDMTCHYVHFLNLNYGDNSMSTEALIRKLSHL
ncbi:hypothetical protein KKB55_00155 [Myxococcota bacterium]|nr:hypothetical protein [Myxococcota bacterium]